MKKIIFGLSTLFIIIGLTGCAYNTKTLEYAKKHNLNEELYSKVVIAGIGNNDINKNQFRNILKKELDKHFNVYYLRLCRTGTLNNVQFLRCMQQQKANFTNINNEKDKSSLSVVTVLSVRQQKIHQTPLMDVYIDKNILSYKSASGNKHPFTKYNNSILKSSMQDYVNSNSDFTFVTSY